MTQLPSFGVVTHAVGHRPMPFAECLARIADAGGEHVMLLTAPNGSAVRPGVPAENQFPNLLESDPDTLVRVLRAHGLGLGSVRPAVEIDVHSDETANASLERAAPYAAFTRRAGCDALCLPPPARQGGPVEHDAAVQRLARLMDQLATTYAITVSVDVHTGSVTETLDDCRTLIANLEVPGSGVLLNLGHLTTGGQPGWEMIEQYPERIPVIGWKDHSLAPDRPYPVYSVEFGTGATPLARYIAACKVTGIATRHFVNVMHAPEGEEVAVLARSLRYLKTLWQATAAEAVA
jgi:sugar phosphate isomerase/epimerase